MTIDGTNISTLGFKLYKLSNHLAQPARKKILDPPKHTAENMVYEEFDVVADMYGKFASEALAGAAVASLKTLLETDMVHTFAIASRSLSFQGLVHNGFIVVTNKKLIRLSVKITITECTAGNLIA